jgi:hypothetical protein
MAAGLLVLAGLGVEEAIKRVSHGRGLPVPETEAQASWLRDLGRLVPAAVTS